MQRSDQILIDYYHRVSRETAKRKMLVDFHGCQKTAVMTRTWPNLISTEGVRGMEWSKWSADSEPEHNVTLPFTRMFLGPMDYTPGAMLNATQTTFAAIHEQPMALGTRCHQLAMYVVFESPLQMLADNPSNYLREPEIMKFLGPVSLRVGRHKSSCGTHRRVRSDCQKERARLVCRRYDRLDGAGYGCWIFLFLGDGKLHYGCLSGWCKCRPGTPADYKKTTAQCEQRNEDENSSRARWWVGGQDSLRELLGR